MDSTPPAPVSGRFTAAAADAAVVVALAGSAIAPTCDRAGTAVFADTLSFAFAVGAVAVVGAVITLAVPGNRVGWLLLAAAALMGAGLALTEAGVHGVVTSPGSVPGAAYMASIGPGLEAAGMLIAVVGVPVIFPDGRLPGPRWRWLAWSAAAAVTCLFLGNVLSPATNEARLAHWQSPLGLPGRYGNIADALSAAGVLLAVAAAAGAVAGLIVRWRRGGPLVRQQLLFLALAACPPALVFVAVMLTNGAGVPGWIFGVVLLPLPVAIAIAVLSHGLYDLRRAAHRTLLWLAMSGTVVGIYAVIVIAVAVLVPDRHAWWPSAIAAAVAALLLIPLRETLQRAVTRVVYGRWHEPYEVLASLGERLEAAADVDRLVDAAITELTIGLDLRDVSVRGLDGTTVAGATTGAGATIALQAYGATVGCLTYRPPERQLSAAGQRLVRDLARQLGGALHARLLREDLAARAGAARRGPRGGTPPWSRGALMTVSIRIARPSLRYCLIRECLQDRLSTTPPVSGPITGRSMVVRKTPGVSRRMRRPKMIPTLAGRPMSRLSAIRASKNARARRGASNTRVRDTSTWRMEISRQYPARWSAGPKGSGRRCSQRWANTSMVPGCSRLQISCKAAGSSQAAKPLDSSVNPIPALAAWRLAHSWPLIQILAG